MSRIFRLERALVGILLTAPALVRCGPPAKLPDVTLHKTITVPSNQPTVDKNSCEGRCDDDPPPTPAGYSLGPQIVCSVSKSDGGPDTVSCDYTFRDEGQSCGRRPAGWTRRPNDAASNPVGRYLATSASLERAAVDAFGHMVNELTYHNAPRELIDRASRAKRDEERHARIAGKLAEKYGGTIAPHCWEAGPVRSLLEVAAENLSEGCIRETYGALIALHQREHAQTTDVRNAMKSIATDEVSHAALSLDVHAWIVTQLDDREICELEILAAETIASLRREVSNEPLDVVAQTAGLPTSTFAVHFVDQLDREVWTQLFAA